MSLETPGRPPPLKAASRAAIPSGVWVLGFVSLFMDASSELVHSLLPVFMISVLGVGALTVGLIEGLAESTAAMTKLFSGVLSDYLGRRKVLVVIGYALAALSKPLFPLAPNVAWVFAARLIDRVGKGIRGAPRDALIGDIAPPEVRGASYGLRQSLDTVGAVAGPLLAVLLMTLLADDFRTVFWFAVGPAAVAVALLLIGVKEPPRTAGRAAARAPFRTANLRRLGAAFWWVVAVGAVMTLARFSEAFLVLRASGVGVPVALVPLVLVVMSGAYAASAYPAGWLSDRIERRHVVAGGLAVLIVADGVLGTATGIVPVIVGVALWGLHMGLTQGLLAALVADAAPASYRGSAFGVFNFVTGLALLLASVIAGWLWDRYGAPATFFAGAGFAVVALIALLCLVRPGVARAGLDP